MTNQIRDIASFVSAAEIFIGNHPATSPQMAKMSERLFSQLEISAPAASHIQGSRLPVCRYLDAAFAYAYEQNDAIRALAAAFATIEPLLTWKQRPNAHDHGSAFLHGHANALLVGAEGTLRHSNIQIGVSLMAPQTHYPIHNHRPDEIYIVMSEGEWQQDCAPWFTPGAGNLVYNPSNIRHAMRAASQPLFAFWFLLPPDN